MTFLCPTLFAHPLVSLLSLAALLTVEPGESVDTGEANEQPDTVIRDHGVNVYQYRKFGITILSLPGLFDFLYLPNDTASVAQIAERSGYRYVVNGSYFHADRTHAGWLSIDDTVYAQAMSESQLTHIVSCDRRSGRVEFIPSAQFASHTEDGVTTFQTGPLVIEGNRLDSARIKASINGRGLYRRTLLAATDSSHVYLITVRSPVSLDVLGRFLLKASVFSKKRLDVVNLDGGRSVALWSRDFPQFGFNQNAHLPILLGVR